MSRVPRGIPVNSANTTPLGRGGGGLLPTPSFSRHEAVGDVAAPPPAKKAREDKRQSFSGGISSSASGFEYAGKRAETIFPDVSTVRVSV